MSLRDRLNTPVNKENNQKYKQQQDQEFTLGSTFTKGVISETNDFGPLDSLMMDPTISSILVNGAKKIYIEKDGNLNKSEVTFKDNQQLRTIIEGIVSNAGRKINENSPMVDVTLLDGSRVNAVIPPLSPDGPCFSIKKSNPKAKTLEDLSKLGFLSREITQVLSLAVKSRLNIVISGGVDTGKTSLLNALSSLIPEDERIISIEDCARLSLQQENIVRLETANINNVSLINTNDLVLNALRMGPDRVIIEKSNNAEVLDMLQSMNTIHNAFLATLYSNCIKETFSKIKAMTTLDLIIQVDKLQDGVRKITSVSEITGIEGSEISTQEIFHYEKITRQHNSTGVIPKFVERFKEKNLSVPLEYFEKTTKHNYPTRISTIASLDLPKIEKNVPIKKQVTKAKATKTTNSRLSQRFKID